MPKLLSALEFAIPFDLVGRLPTSSHSSWSVLFSRSVVEQKFGEQPLRPLIAFDGVDGERADDRLRHRHVDLPVAVIDADGPIGLLEDDRSSAAPR